jgi:hypothetical protein
MVRWWKFKFMFVLLMAVSSTGCALGMVDQALGDKKAAHADDQSAGPAGSETQNSGYMYKN